MDIRKRLTKRDNLTAFAEAVVTAGVLLLFACLFDYRYAMNDDVFIKSIVSGQYSGMPDIHNIQGIVVLNAIFALLYRVCDVVPWYGFFIVASQFVSLYGIFLCLAKKMRFYRPWRWLLMTAVHMLLLGMMVQELVMVQYTYTAALLVASATVRLYCLGEERWSEKTRGQYIGIMLQYLLAFCLRTEIFLFLLPLSMLLTLICRRDGNDRKTVGRKLGSWGILWGSLLLCVGVLYAADHMGYSGEGWKEYRTVFDYRTQLYDFLTLPDYEGNREFYETAGISNAQYELLKNYNFSLDDGITAETLKKVVDYANETRISGYQGLERLYMRMFTLPLREGLWSYAHRTLFDPKVAADDYPWNFVCAALYFVLFLLTCFSGRAGNLLYMLLMFSVRSGLWMYIILRQRTPPRVTHSLFVMEIVCLLLLVFEEMSYLEREKERRKLRWLFGGVAALFLAGAGAVSVSAGSSFVRVYRDTVAYNKEWETLLEYFAGREENFYFLDVYSTVNYSQEIFAGEGFRPENYDLCGGWLAKSPLCEEKYGRFGFASPQEALCEKENVFFVAACGSELAWLYDVYEERGIQIRLEYLETVAEQFDIIRLSAFTEAE